MTGLSSLTAALLCVVLGAGAAYAEDDNSALQQRLDRLGFQPGEVVDRVPNFRVNGWNYLDDSHVMIHGGPSRRFLIELRSRCQGLSTSQSIGFSATASQLTRFDNLVVRGPGGRPQSCPIGEIRELIPKQETK